MYGIKITIEGATPKPICIEIGAESNAVGSRPCTIEPAQCADENELHTLNTLRMILKRLRAIESEQQRQAQRITVQGRAIREILATVHRIEHPSQPPRVPTTMVVTFGAPVAE